MEIMEHKLIPATATTIEPSDIDTSKPFWDAFGNSETETSAIWIVNFCKDRGEGWADFTYADIEAYYQSKGKKDGFWFNRLFKMQCLYDKTFKPKESWDRHSDDDVIAIDFRFVARCYVSSLGCSFN